MKALIYDIEIVNAIPLRKEAPIYGISYCAGWQDHANMGISVIGGYETDTGRYRVWCADNREEFFEVADKAELLVTFNGIGFDDKVIRACWSNDFDPGQKSYDLLVEIWRAAGLGPTFDYRTHGGYGLDAMCEKNFGLRKTGNGALAPVLWQQGKVGQVIDYCLNDIRMTAPLFDCAVIGQPLMDPNNEGEMLYLLDPLRRIK